jgi:hypothetical protein
MPSTSHDLKAIHKRDQRAHSWKKCAASSFIIICVFLFAVSSSRHSVWLGRQLISGLLVPIFCCALAALLSNNKSLLNIAFSFAVAVAMFVLPLFWLWSSGTSETMLIGGLLPFSDASGYLSDARTLLNGPRFEGVGRNHPLATAMLSVLWARTHANYRSVLFVLNFLCATASWLAMSEVSMVFGAGASAVWLLVDFLFVRRFIGIPMSETLGVILANFGIALGCLAVRKGNRSDYALAIFAFSLALCARSGAFLTVPALIVGAFAAWPERTVGRWTLPFTLIASALTAFILNFIVGWALVDHATSSPSNAVYVLHSIVYGGTWEDAMNKYGIDSIAVWNAVKSRLAAHPLALLGGGWRAIWTFATKFYLFTFVGSLLHLLFLFGVFASVRSIRLDWRAWWIVSFAIGLLTSIPFLPPWDTDGMRAYAATIPLISLTTAVGSYSVIHWMAHTPLNKWFRNKDFIGFLDWPRNCSYERILRPLTSCLLIATVALCLPLSNMVSYGKLPTDSSITKAYARNRTQGSVEFLQNANLHLVADTEATGITLLHLSDFRGGLSDFRKLYPAEADLLSKLPSNSILLPGSTDGMSLIAIDDRHIPAAGGTQIIDLHLDFLAAGWLLIAADEEIVTRSAQLEAYCSTKIGHFSFGIRHYPVILAGDVVLYSGIIYLVQPANPLQSGADVNPGVPLCLDGRRLRFPLPGEYYLKINRRDTLKLLVLKRNEVEADSTSKIVSFVNANCNESESNVSGSSSESPVKVVEKWFESDEPATTSRATIKEIIRVFGHDLKTTISQEGVVP